MITAAVRLKSPCRSRQVVAVLISSRGEVFVGSNGVDFPQKQCPRKIRGDTRGEGWELCRDICHQAGHAEIDVLFKAGPAARGAGIYILGHDCACGACHRAMERAGVAWYLPVPDQNYGEMRRVFLPEGASNGA